ncbi:MAG: cytochrome b [Gammaproteobacteria bacterium]|nr:cytochrome b [Gammaproteobacteria bacterium]
MQILNSQYRYGLVAITLHWLMAPAIIGNFALGLWMTGLSYQHPWYHQAPQIHKSIGILLFMALLLRLLWRWGNQSPKLEPSPHWQILIAKLTHRVIYCVLLMIVFSGYLISTADGRSIDVFGWFDVPATIYNIDGQEDIAGEVHEWLAWSLIVLVVIHALAALKHHFYNRDSTLRKMLGMPTK